MFPTFRTKHKKDAFGSGKGAPFLPKMRRKAIIANTLETLKMFFRFANIESFFILNLFPFFNLKSEYIFRTLELFTFLTFACNFNLSAGNLGLFEKNGIYFVRTFVNSQNKKSVCFHG